MNDAMKKADNLHYVIFFTLDHIISNGKCSLKIKKMFSLKSMYCPLEKYRGAYRFNALLSYQQILTYMLRQGCLATLHEV